MTQANQGQKESPFSSIRKTLGLVSTGAKQEEKEEGEEEHEEEVIFEDDPLALLMNQHREVEALFAEIEGTGEKAHKTKERLLKNLADKLLMHAELEEKIFYPAAREADETLVLESYEEHAAMKNMLKRIGTTKGGDESLDAKVTVLKELIEQHVKEEENSLFPKCREVLGEERLEELASLMGRRMDRMEQKPKTASRAKTAAMQKKRTTKAKAKAPAKARKRTTRSRKKAA